MFADAPLRPSLYGYRVALGENPMFGLFKAKPAPQGPAVVEAAIEINCAADTLFGLLNFADAHCWKRTEGTVETVAPGRFRLHLDLLPDHAFTIIVSDAEPGRRYAFNTQITPRAGRMTHATERYKIDPIGAGHCSVRLVTEAHFEAGMSRSEWQAEVALVEQAVHTTLARLSSHAEQGVGAIHEIEKTRHAA